MKAKWGMQGLVFVLLAFTSSPAVAQAEEVKAAAGASTYFSVSIATLGFALALAALFGATAQGRAIAAALDAMGRQPGAAARLQLALIIGLAFIESLVIYVLLIALLLFFANPYGKIFGL
jgi:F-type H+-transporting ATPase subunit c